MTGGAISIKKSSKHLIASRETRLRAAPHYNDSVDIHPRIIRLEEQRNKK